MNTNHSVIGIRKWFLFFRTNTSNTYNYTHEKNPLAGKWKDLQLPIAIPIPLLTLLQTKLQLKKVVFATLIHHKWGGGATQDSNPSSPKSGFL